MKIITHPFDKAVIASTHDSSYLMHKYWARKPANVVSDYIEYFTNQGDLVLDPFSGSGVTAIEAAKLNRKAIYNDLSPTARFIAENTIRKVDIDAFNTEFQKILARVYDEVIELFYTTCKLCGYEKAITTHTFWQQEKYSEKDKIICVKTQCQKCGKKDFRNPNEIDFLLDKKIDETELKYWIPDDELVENGRLLVKEGMKVTDLFRKRALIVLSTINYYIDSSTASEDIKQTLKFTFTSSLAQSSKLVPFYSKKGREYEVGGWTLPGFWIPAKYCEVNAINCFNERFKKIKNGKSSIVLNVLDNIKWKVGDAARMDYIQDDSVDYIFTDPPYGDSVPYLEYHVIWASWLKQKLDFNAEVVISDSKKRSKKIDDYKKLLQLTFNECHRVLKPDQWMTVTFHNSHIKVWNALVASAFEAGFEYMNDCYVLTGRLSSNQLLRQSGSMTGDIYINFRKPKRKKQVLSKELEEVKKELFKEAEKVIIERGGTATTDQLARGILMSLSRNNLFGKVIDFKITDILSEKFDYDSEMKVWTFRENKEAKLLEYIPLETRIRTVVDSVLTGKRDGCSLDDFLVPLFTKFKNGRTPDAKEIVNILKDNAIEKNGKWFPPIQQELFEKEIFQERIYKEDDVKIENEHNAIIYQLAKVGISQGYNIWIGENEKRKTRELRKLSSTELIIPGLSAKGIKDSRIDQIDLIWFNADTGSYILFEVENSTRLINCIPRLANLTEKLPTLNIPIYIVIPDNIFSKAEKSFNDPSHKKLLASDKHVILYSTLFDNLDLLDSKEIEPKDFLNAVSIHM
ncbi:MAG: DNA methyltransferase [Ginsengibacter sp.]